MDKQKGDYSSSSNKNKSIPFDYTPWLIGGGCLIVLVIILIIIVYNAKSKE